MVNGQVEVTAWWCIFFKKNLLHHIVYMYNTEPNQILFLLDSSLDEIADWHFIDTICEGEIEAGNKATHRFPQ